MAKPPVIKTDEWIRFWHWTHRNRRASIIKDGLRRCTFLGGRLYLCGALVHYADTVKGHVQFRHQWADDQMEGWFFRAPLSDCQEMSGGYVRVCRDIPPGDLIGPFSRPSVKLPKHIEWGTVF